MLVKIGKGIELDVTVGRLPANVVEHVMYIGLRNLLMDAHSSITKEEFPDDFAVKSREVSMAKLEAMYNGEVRMVAERESDPVRNIALRNAEALARMEWKQTAVKGDKFDNPRHRAVEYLAAHPELTEMAEAIAAIGKK